METATTSLAIPASFNLQPPSVRERETTAHRIASSHAISQNGFIDIFTCRPLPDCWGRMRPSYVGQVDALIISRHADADGIVYHALDSNQDAHP